MARITTVTALRYLGHIHHIDVLVSKLESSSTNYFIFTLRDTVNESKWTQFMYLLGRVLPLENRLALLESEIYNHPEMIKLHSYKKHVNLFIIEK